MNPSTTQWRMYASASHFAAPNRCRRVHCSAVCKHCPIYHHRLNDKNVSGFRSSDPNAKSLTIRAESGKRDKIIKVGSDGRYNPFFTIKIQSNIASQSSNFDHLFQCCHMCTVRFQKKSTSLSIDTRRDIPHLDDGVQLGFQLFVELS